MSAMPVDFFGSVLFNVIPVIVILGFVLVFVLIIVSLAKGARQWSRNNGSPVLTVEATVATKRMDVRHHHHNTDDMHHHTSSTAYYATFEVASGDRLEFEIRGTEHGLLAEGDNGKLTFQGTRYLGFERA